MQQMHIAWARQRWLSEWESPERIALLIEEKAETAREKAETAQAKQNVQIIGEVNDKMSDLTSRRDQLSYEQKTARINAVWSLLRQIETNDPEAQAKNQKALKALGQLAQKAMQENKEAIAESQ